MASITGTVSPAVLNNTLNAKQPRLLEPKVAVGKPHVAQTKPLRHDVPVKVHGGPHKVADGFTCRPPDSAGRATQAKQLHEIADGLRSGKLTAKEAESLLKAQQDVFTASKRAMADGKLTVKEKVELATMEKKAQAQIDSALKGGGRSLGVIFGGNNDARKQAAQLDTLADGISKGTITRAETGKLLGQQVSIADARGDADTKAEKADVSRQLARAGKDLERHGKAGTQLDVKVAVAIGKRSQG